MRYYIDLKTNRLIDRKGELSDIHLDDKVDFYELCEHLNQQEVDKLKYKMQLKNFKYQVKKLIE